VPIELDARHLGEALPEPVTQPSHSRGVRGHFQRGDPVRDTHADDLVSRQRAGAQPALLPATVQQRHEADARLEPDAERADTLRTVHFVSRQREQVDAVALDIERQLASALGSVDVEQHAAGTAQPSDGADVLHDADLVVDVHQRNQDRLRPQRGLDLCGLDDAIATRHEIRDRETLSLELAARVEHGRMLRARSDDVLAARTVEARRAEQREVVGLRGARSPDHLRGPGSDQARNLLPRLLHARARAAPGRVTRSRRIGKVTVDAQASRHRLDDPRVHRRGRRIVQVDHAAHGSDPGRGG
jgi:hypothetical protein